MPRRLVVTHAIFVVYVVGAGDAAAAGGESLMLWKRRFLDAMRYRHAAVHDKKVQLHGYFYAKLNKNVSDEIFSSL